MQALLFKKRTQNGGSLYTPVLVKKNDISELIEDSDAVNTKKQRKYAVSRMYLKNYDISCLINSFAKSNSLFWYYIKQIMNVFIRAMVRIFSFGERWNVLFNSAIASLNRTFHLSPHENILTIALINIHYLYIIAYKLTTPIFPFRKLLGALYYTKAMNHETITIKRTQYFMLLK